MNCPYCDEKLTRGWDIDSTFPFIHRMYRCDNTGIYTHPHYSWYSLDSVANEKTYWHYSETRFNCDREKLLIRFGEPNIDRANVDRRYSRR